MPKVKYGSKQIEYEISVERHLTNTYLQVEQNQPVLYRTPIEISEDEANKDVLKKASWVLKKLALVAEPHTEVIRTGSRIPYLGRRYYVEIHQSEKSSVEHTGAKITIFLNECDNTEELLYDFYKSKAIEKVKPRFNRWVKLTGLKPSSIKFIKMEKRWGSCTVNNDIHINPEVVKLSWSLIDYLIVHELCHIVHKDHSPEFWKEVEKWLPDYKIKDEKLDLYSF